MIQQAHIDQRERLFQAGGHGTVGGAGFGIAAGVVVADDDRCRALRQRAFDQNPWMHFGTIDAAVEQRFEAQCAMTRVQEQGREYLAWLRAQALGEIAASGGRVTQGDATFELCGQVALAKFQCSREHAGTGRTQPRQFGHRLWAAIQQAAQGAVRVQQVACGGDCIASSGAGTEEDREQFGIGQDTRPAAEELLAGTFIGRPVAYVHDANIRAGADIATSGQGLASGKLSAHWMVRKSRRMQAPALPSGMRHIVLCVCGGIAAYKAAELVRRLRDDPTTRVIVAMTENAQRFVGAQTFQALSGQPVRTSLWDAQAEAAMGHLELAHWASHVIVAPATANSIARLAHGMADDLVSTLCLATTAPLTIAPAMNHRMWLHPATQANIATLRARGAQVVGPNDGPLAEGESGPGRMAEPADIVAALKGAKA